MTTRIPCGVGLSLTLLGLCVCGCGRATLSGPPELRLGRDECGECGMLISEDRCSSALLVERDGRREHVLYDDIGCMLDAEAEGLDGEIVERFVHDHATKQWVTARSATLLLADPDALPTPMGSGIVAFASAVSAQEAQAAHGGALLAYEQLPAARRERETAGAVAGNMGD